MGRKRGKRLEFLQRKLSWSNTCSRFACCARLSAISAASAEARVNAEERPQAAFGSQQEQPAATSQPLKIAFLFMVDECFYAESVWHAYLRDVPANQYTIVTHQQGMRLDDPLIGFDDVVAFGSPEARAAGRATTHFVPTAYDAKRFSVSLARVGLLLAKHALEAEPAAQCFVLLSGTTVPVVSFQGLRAMIFCQMRDGSGWQCRSNFYATLGQHDVLAEGPRSVSSDLAGSCDPALARKTGQWYLLDRAQVRALVEHSAEVEVCVLDLLANKTNFVGAFDEWIVGTELNVVEKLLQNDQNETGDGQQQRQQQQLGGVEQEEPLQLTYCAWDSEEELLPAPLRLFALDRKGKLGDPWSFDASLLARRSMKEIRDSLPSGTAFLRKVLLNDTVALVHDSSGGSESPPASSCREQKQRFETAANVANLPT